MTQATLPNRRHSIAESIIWEGNEVHLRAGLDHAGQVKEIFIHGGKVGSAFEALTAEFAILISRMLQSGVTIEMTRKMFGRLDSGAPASIAGAAVDWLAALEKELTA